MKRPLSRLMVLFGGLCFVCAQAAGAKATGVIWVSHCAQGSTSRHLLPIDQESPEDEEGKTTACHAACLSQRKRLQRTG